MMRMFIRWVKGKSVADGREYKCKEAWGARRQP
jgi:hypothetical protein